MKLSVGVSALLNWARFAGEQPMKMKPRTASALNQMGDALLRNLAIDLSRTTGLSVDIVRSMIRTTRATTSKLEYNVDASRLADPRLMKGRELPDRDFPRREDPGFAPTELVNVQTAGDDRVCDICDNIAASGPYTIEVARAMIPHHPNCRCTLVPFRPTNRIPVKFATRFGAAPRTASLSIMQMAKKVLAESNFKMKIMAR